MKGSVIVGPVAKECVGLHLKIWKVESLMLILRLTYGPVLQLRLAPLYDLDMVQSHFFHRLTFSSVTIGRVTVG